jgi:hypothetical protein
LSLTQARRATTTVDTATTATTSEWLAPTEERAAFAIGITSQVVVVDDEDARVPVLNQGVYRAAFRRPVGDEV